MFFFFPIAGVIGSIIHYPKDITYTAPERKGSYSMLWFMNDVVDVIFFICFVFVLFLFFFLGLFFNTVDWKKYYKTVQLSKVINCKILVNTNKLFSPNL